MKQPLRNSLAMTITRRVVSALSVDVHETVDTDSLKLSSIKQSAKPIFTHIAGYKLISLLGRGGMGDVWEGQKDDQRVAIKILKKSTLDAETIARFKREVDIGMELDHPNIIRVFDHGVHTDGFPYMIMEYLQGMTLAKMLKNGAIPIARTFEILRQVCDGLQVAHDAGLVHRDLKPHNIFLSPDNNVKLLDFGISKKKNSMTIITDSDMIIGTPNYMAPEQAIGNHHAVNPSTDVFAIGLLMYEMFSGQRAFPGKILHDIVFNVVYRTPKPLSLLITDLPNHIYSVVEKAMAKDQSDRFQSVRELYQTLSGELPSAPAPVQSKSSLAKTVQGKTLFVTRVSERSATACTKRKPNWPLLIFIALSLAIGALVYTQKP